ncbi:MlaD family protein [Amorphus sp. 3PC139-8]|uniref:MCE family protein n=1 Tax=Amorphus sp. 3PC139-8 TaxID=2735676 RepID=UPI00345DD1C9
METRANYIAVGLFVLAVLAGALGFVYWLYSSGNTTQRTPIRVIFHDPVTGLSVGSAVIFNGIRIGDVTKLGFVAPDSPVVLVEAQVDRNAPLKTDTKAELGVQGLTGVSYISLSGGQASSPSLFSKEGVPEITAQRSAIQDLLEGARSILVKADEAVDNLNKVISDNREKISQTVSNVETFSNALAENSDNIDRLITDISDAGAAIAKVAPHVESVVSRADTLLAEVQPQDVRTVVDNVVTFSNHLVGFQDDVTKIVTDVTKAAQDLQVFASGLNKSLEDVDQLITSLNASQIQSIVDGVQSVVAAISGRTDEIDSLIADASASAAHIRTISETVSDQNADIQQTIAAVRSASERADGILASLQPTADRLDGILAAVDPTQIHTIVDNVQSVVSTFAGRTQEIDSFIADASVSAANVRTVSQTVSDQNAEIQQAIASISSASARADSLLASLQPTVDQLDGLLAAIDPAKVGTIVDNVGNVVQAVSDRSEDISAMIADARDTAASARAFADKLDAQKDTVDQVAQNAREISDKLNAASTRVNDLVDKVGTMVEGDGQGLITEATEAFRAIKVIAQAFESRAVPISAGLERFSTSGVDDFRGVMDQARQTLREIERTFSNLDRNPSRVIFGGPEGPRYQPQRR